MHVVCLAFRVREAYCDWIKRGSLQHRLRHASADLRDVQCSCTSQETGKVAIDVVAMSLDGAR